MSNYINIFDELQMKEYHIAREKILDFLMDNYLFALSSSDFNTLFSIIDLILQDDKINVFNTFFDTC
jgi:hypothetical protein